MPIEHARDSRKRPHDDRQAAGGERDLSTAGAKPAEIHGPPEIHGRVGPMPARRGFPRWIVIGLIVMALIIALVLLFQGALPNRVILE